MLGLFKSLGAGTLVPPWALISVNASGHTGVPRHHAQTLGSPLYIRCVAIYIHTYIYIYTYGSFYFVSFILPTKQIRDQTLKLPEAAATYDIYSQIA